MGLLVGLRVPRSAARWWSQAIGVVLSGGGSDGTVGIGAIKEAGGFALAQSPDSPDPVQPSMPAKAIATGLVDIVLPIEEMADRLVQLANGRPPQGGLAEQAGEQD